MTTQSDNSQSRKAATLFVSVFGGFALLTFVVGLITGDARGFGFSTAGAGAAIASLSLLALGPANAQGRRSPNRLGWALLLIGAAVMLTGPFIMMSAEVDFAEQIGSSRVSWTMGIHTFIVSAIAAIIVWAAVRSAIRSARRSKSQTRAAAAEPRVDTESIADSTSGSGDDSSGPDGMGRRSGL